MKGTFAAADITLYHVKKKVAIKEPSYVAYEVATGKVLAIGKEAKDMLCDGKRVKCVSPFHQGRVDDFDVARALFKQLFKMHFAGSVLKPRVAVCLPFACEKIFLTACEQLMLVAGAREAVLFEGIVLEEFLKKTPEAELKKYAGVVEISKDDLEEYARELLEETCDTMRVWGITKEELERMVKEVCKAI